MLCSSVRQIDNREARAQQRRCEIPQVVHALESLPNNARHLRADFFDEVVRDGFLEGCELQGGEEGVGADLGAAAPAVVAVQRGDDDDGQMPVV